MDNKLFDATVDLKLRQFYILAYGGSIASILGFVTNIFIYGFTGPTFFYGFCTLVVTLLGVIGCSTRNYRRIAHILLCMFAFVEFPALYYIYGGGTIVYMVASISAIAIFVTEKWSMPVMSPRIRERRRSQAIPSRPLHRIMFLSRSVSG